MTCVDCPAPLLHANAKRCKTCKAKKDLESGRAYAARRRQGVDAPDLPAAEIERRIQQHLQAQREQRRRAS